MLTRERGSGDWVGLVTEAVAVTVVGEVAGGLVTRARGSEDCLVLLVKTETSCGGFLVLPMASEPNCCDKLLCEV